MGRLARSVATGLLAFVTYIIYTGSIKLYDLVTGVIVACIVGLLTANITLTNPSKVFNPKRAAWLIAYAIKYFFYYEVKAHLDVMYRILHPKMPIRPGIVRVYYDVESDYAITAVANSITNTPGTVVVDLDEKKKIYYVHWINVKGIEPKVTKEISRGFEFFAKKVFD